VTAKAGKEKPIGSGWRNSAVAELSLSAKNSSLIVGCNGERPRNRKGRQRPRVVARRHLVVERSAVATVGGVE
jgi:hypothetical protein